MRDNGILDIALGQSSSCFVKPNGFLQCLHEEHLNKLTIPTDLIQSSSKVTAGSFHTCYDINGMIKCNTEGDLFKNEDSI